MGIYVFLQKLTGLFYKKITRYSFYTKIPILALIGKNIIAQKQHNTFTNVTCLLPN
jgi:hypothetical protein